ncbi:hypothetical protein [Sessilibacter corallicola]|uniref:Uncharacterized protein n=1 Tax=Sessilibacter corallicola TaxID=2904075 RepID=A0ABQ0AE07_9GAMM
MLYTLIGDDKFRAMIWDRAHISEYVGDSDSGGDLDDRIDLRTLPKPFKQLFPEPLRVSFPELSRQDKKKEIPDICDVQARLFLSIRAYNALKHLIEADGEFIPVTYEHGQGYFFNPLNVAEDVDALNSDSSVKDDWGYVQNLAFYEEKVKEWALFRCQFNNYASLYCSESIKKIIDEENLTGLCITSDLAAVFP